MTCHLEEELRKAAETAKENMLEDGSLMPVLLLFGAKDGEDFQAILSLGFTHPESSEERQKMFASLGAHFSGCVGELEAVIHVEEAWARGADEFGQPDEATKREVIIITATRADLSEETAVMYTVVRAVPGDEESPVVAVELLDPSVFDSGEADMQKHIGEDAAYEKHHYQDYLARQVIAGYQSPSTHKVYKGISAINLDTGAVMDTTERSAYDPLSLANFE